MINSLVQTVFYNIFEHTNLKQQSHFLKRCRELCLPVKEEMTKQRLVFIVSQYILTLIDKHVSQKNQYKKRQQKYQLYVKNNIQQHHNIQQEKQKTSGFLQLAFIIYRTFCPSNKATLQDGIKSIIQFQSMISLNEEQVTLEIIQLRQNIELVHNFNQKFQCHCQQSRNNFSRCQNCFNAYHPSCQSQKLVCNKCFVKFYMVPLQNKFLSPFGGNKDTQTYFCGHINTFKHQQIKRSMFHLIRFELQDLNNIKNSNDKQIILKIKNCRIMQPFTHQKNPRKKTKAQLQKKKQDIFTLDDTDFELFFNFYKIRNSQIQFQNRNSLIIKIEPHKPRTTNNILIIKTQASPGLTEPHQYMIGVYKITKLKAKDQGNFPLGKTISKTQSQILKKSVGNGQIKNQFLNQQFVRSYGCDHYQKFNFTKLKETIKAKQKNQSNEQNGQNNQPVVTSRITKKNRQNKYLHCPICSKHLYILHYDYHSIIQKPLQQKISFNQNAIQIQSSNTSQIHLSDFQIQIQQNQQQQSVKQLQFINLESSQDQGSEEEQIQNQNAQIEQDTKLVIQIDSQ